MIAWEYDSMIVWYGTCFTNNLDKVHSALFYWSNMFNCNQFIKILNYPLHFQHFNLIKWKIDIFRPRDRTMLGHNTNSMFNWYWTTAFLFMFTQILPMSRQNLSGRRKMQTFESSFQWAGTFNWIPFSVRLASVLEASHTLRLKNLRQGLL